MRIWYAVNGKGQGRIFTSLPVREEHFKIWTAESVGCISMTAMLLESEGELDLPATMTWKDDPMELELTIK